MKNLYFKLFLSYFSDFPVLLNHETDIEGKSIRVVWSSLVACPLERYTVRYREVLRIPGFGIPSSNWTTVYVSSKETHLTLKLGCHKMYEIAVTAKISGGETLLNHSKWLKIRTGQGK